MSLTISILSVPVTDQSVAKQFYIDVLGFELIVESPMGPNQIWVQLGLPGTQTTITLVNWFDSMPAGSLQGTVIATDDIESEIATLRKRGLNISDVDATPWGKFAQFKDPDNNGWVLEEKPSVAGS